MALRTVVIGLGKRSCEVHLPAIAQSANFELVAVCDTDSERAREVGKQYGVYNHDNLGEMISAQDFQVAIVSIPHYAYLSVITTLITAGKHIIKEKPFAVNVAEARQLLQILHGSSSYLGVSVQRRFNPIYQRFNQLRRYIGKVYSIEGAYTMNVTTLGEGWRASKNLSGGGALVDMGYHFVDLLIWYFGMPVSVTARMTRGNRLGQKYDVEDTAILLFDYHLNSEYDKKVIGCLVISRVYPEKHERLRVFGTNGAIEVSMGFVRLLDVNGIEIERLELQAGWPSEAVDQLDHFAERIRHFVPGCVPDYTEHLQHVAVIEAAYESDRSGTSCQASDMLKLIQGQQEMKLP